MFGDPKKAASSILGETPEAAEPEGAGDEGLRAAAESLIAAVHGKSVDGVVSALKSFTDQCEAGEAGDDETEE